MFSVVANSLFAPSLFVPCAAACKPQKSFCPGKVNTVVCRGVVAEGLQALLALCETHLNCNFIIIK